MPNPSTRTNLSRALVLLAALPGAWYGFEFGLRLDGVLLGAVLALNGAASRSPNPSS